MKSNCTIDCDTVKLAEIQKGFGAMTVEDLAAAMYHTFHGECDCTKHPWNNDGTPWCKYRSYGSDAVVHAFRAAAIEARKVLKEHDIGKVYEY